MHFPLPQDESAKDFCKTVVDTLTHSPQLDQLTRVTRILFAREWEIFATKFQGLDHICEHASSLFLASTCSYENKKGLPRARDLEREEHRLTWNILYFTVVLVRLADAVLVFQIA